ncbi:MAG: zeta toxin family protein [Deltaproteobacteria bacterium]|nr:zeta toxin family protein [Deltaproteobacteria bacterium]
MENENKIVIIAGPNGAGKTTFAKEYLVKDADCPYFVNADLIAAGLSPFTPDQAALRAGRLMLEEIREYTRRKVNFAFETTLSGLIYTRYIREWHKTGYLIKLIFLSLPDVEIALERVKVRVAQGGHNVDESIIRRRFDKGLNNFHNVYKKLVDNWILYDNSDETPRLIDEGENL